MHIKIIFVNKASRFILRSSFIVMCGGARWGGGRGVHLLDVPTAPSAVGAGFGVELGRAKLLGPCGHALARGSEDAVLPAIIARVAVMIGSNTDTQVG